MPGPITFLRRLIMGSPGADAASKPPGPLDDFWYSDPGSLARTAGQRVTPERALQVGAYYRGVNVLANAVAQLPLKVYRRTFDAQGNETGKTPAKDHPAYKLLALKPNAWQTSVEWRRQAMGHVLLRGNAYCLLIGNPRGDLEQLVLLRPERMQVEQLPNWRVRYRYRWEDGKETIFPQENVSQLRAFSTDGLVGLAPVTLARVTLGSGLSMEEFGARQFAQAPKTSGFLKVPAQLDDETERRLSASFRAAWSGPSGWHGVPILHSGMDWVNGGMNNRDAEFLASRQFTVAEIARWLGVPPHLLADLSRATFSNIEHQSIDFLTHSVMPWLRLIEDRLTLDLFDAAGEEDLFAEFLVDGLLRADSKTRAETHAIYLDKGVRSPNEVRAIEGMNPREGGDDFLMQVNATRPIGPAPAPPAAAPPPADDAEENEDDA